MDINKIPKMDALFIRARTDPMNVTYVAAQMAAFHGIPVIDDPASIRICSDKINMYSHLMKKNVAIPKTVFLSKNDLSAGRVARLFDELGTPIIVKEPSTSFSLRVEKVNDIAGFIQVAHRFIRLSDWIVAQQYIESRYDWRVGVLDGKLLYACKYTIPPSRYRPRSTGISCTAGSRAFRRMQSLRTWSNSGLMLPMQSGGDCTGWI